MTLIFAHRGASSICPENTLSAFKKACQIGADGIELDVQLSKDHIPVIIHDSILNRTTDGKGKVSSKKLTELKALDAGSWFSPDYKNEKIPTLAEVLAWAKTTNLIVNIELKKTDEDHPLEEKVNEVILLHNMMDRVIISSFNSHSLIKMKKINSAYKTSLIYKQKVNVPFVAFDMELDALHPHYKNVSKRYVKTMHKHNIKVRPYTINQEKIMRKLMGWNVDAIITDRPETAMRIRHELKRNIVLKMFSAIKGPFFKK